ncbi:MAG: hypothetical protein HC927_11580 [Deltaproteobacteria bacterium]|nr:hypothetical protein [Deltaproteobacteria bacterium]
MARVHGLCRRQRIDEPNPRLQVGDRIIVEVSRSNTHAEWFVTAVGIDVAGSPSLLDASEPDGRQLLPGETARIGWCAYRRAQGLSLSWPEGVGPDRPRPATIIVLASRRPIELGHLVVVSRRPPGRRRRAWTRLIGTQPRPRTGPELARDWAAVVIEYELSPNHDEFGHSH